eukprot:6959147-Pyramimonas_sp.AAC.1
MVHRVSACFLRALSSRGILAQSFHWPAAVPRGTCELARTCSVSLFPRSPRELSVCPPGAPIGAEFLFVAPAGPAGSLEYSRA